jgi:hypothetical protein
MLIGEGEDLSTFGNFSALNRENLNMFRNSRRLPIFRSHFSLFYHDGRGISTCEIFQSLQLELLASHNRVRLGFSWLCFGSVSFECTQRITVHNFRDAADAVFHVYAGNSDL